MRVTVTGATGLIGRRLVGALRERGNEVTVLSRDPDRALARLGGGPGPRGAGPSASGVARLRRHTPAPETPHPDLNSVRWDPVRGPAPAEALAGRDAVVHLAGEPVAQRWSGDAKERIRVSRERGTANLVAGLRAAQEAPRVLVSASAVGYYGPRGDEEIDESATPGDDFLARVCVAWEREAQAAAELGVRVAIVRTGVVLDANGGALAKMLPPFRAGIGGPAAGGRQWMPWIHVDDLVGIYLAALDGGADWSGPLNGSAPAPATNAELSRALGRVLHRPAIAPVPAFALRLLYGEMAEIVTSGQRAVPRRPLALGYAFRHAELEPALRAALG